MTVQIKIEDQMYADYLRHLFAVENNILKVNSEHGMGRLLIAHCRVSAKPVSNLEGDGVITLRLPIVAATQNLQHKFLYYSAGDIAQLNLALRSYFDLDFTRYYRRGEGLEFSKKDILEGFITSRGLLSKDYFEALGKRVYRAQEKQRALLMKKLQRKMYYIEESLDASGLKK